MRQAYLQIWVCEPVADCKCYQIVSSDNEGTTFSLQQPFLFHIDDTDEPFEPRLILSLHDDVHIADMPGSCEDGVRGDVRFPEIALKTDLGNHTEETAWLTVIYDVRRGTHHETCNTTTIRSVTFPNGKISMTKM